VTSQHPLDIHHHHGLNAAAVAAAADGGGRRLLGECCDKRAAHLKELQYLMRTTGSWWDGSRATSAHRLWISHVKWRTNIWQTQTDCIPTLDGHRQTASQHMTDKLTLAFNNVSGY